MNTEALFLFLILLLGLVLCSFLGGNCHREGFSIDIPPITIDMNQQEQGSLSQGSTSQGSTSQGSSYDNYNHYNGSSTSQQLANGMVFNDNSGNTITVIINSDGTKSLQLQQVGQSTPMVLTSTPPPSSNIVATQNTFYAPFGGSTATIIYGDNGNVFIKFNLPNGKSMVFTASTFTPNNNTNPNSNVTPTSTQYYGSTGNTIQSSDYSLAYTNPYATSYGANDGSAGAVTGPQNNTAYYAQGPNGNTVAGVSGNNGYGTEYYSTMPSGVTKSQIPPGQEHLYILKSEIVPPVCPACPAGASCPRQEKCPPCPACARCPEAAFECKKVPNYNAIDNEYLPQPVISSFSSFGM
jgi:hypothetical protein